MSLAVVALIVAWIWPIVDPNWSQDRCTFGHSTSQHYAQLLGAAHFLADMDRVEWVRLVAARDREKGSGYLQNHYRILSAGMSSVAERIAVMHAVARAHGGEFRHTEPDVPEPWSATPGPAAVLFVYRFNVNRAGDWRLLQPWTRIRGKFAITDIEPSFEYNRPFQRNTMSMLLSTRSPASRLGSPHSSRFHKCPPIPEQEWEGAFLHGVTESPEVEGLTDQMARNARSLIQLSDNFTKRGRPRLALRYLEHASTLQAEILGERHIDRAETYDKLAAAYAASGQPLKAADNFGRAIDIRIRAGTSPE